MCLWNVIWDAYAIFILSIVIAKHLCNIQQIWINIENKHIMKHMFIKFALIVIEYGKMVTKSKFL